MTKQMERKNMSMEECENYLKKNPKGECVDEVRKHLIHAYEDNIRWIDVAQFKEANKKERRKRVSALLSFIMLFSIAIAALFWFIWSQHDYEPDFKWIIIVLSLGPISFFSLMGFITSLSARQVYYVEDGDEKQRVRVVKNREGRMGLFFAGYAMAPILPIKYDRIIKIDDDSYICQRRGKCGLYNRKRQEAEDSGYLNRRNVLFHIIEAVGERSMTVPIVYDDIYSITDGAVEFIKDGVISRFSHEGYIMETIH